MTPHELAAALVRTTLATSAASCLAVVLLGLLKVQSPRTHRVAWLLVILQGWLLIPWRLELESPPAPPQSDAEHARPSSSWAWEPSETTQAVVLTTESAAPPRDLADLAAPAALAAWGAGLVVAVLVAAWRYARIVRTLPLGAAPADPQWRAEWRRARRGLAHCAQSAEQHGPVPLPRRKRSRQKRRVHFRISQSLGPLLAFVPWRYLILAPRPLWLALTAGQREAILRHELAHLHRRDLWKSLAIRALALPQWFNPLAWLAVRRFDEAAEWACDDAVARRDDAAPITLAQSLVRTAELLQTTPAAPAGMLPFHGGVLARRIRRLVTPRFKEESNMKRLIVPLLLAALAAAQLIRIERVAASDHPPSQGGARGGTADAAGSSSTPEVADSTTPHAEDPTVSANDATRLRLSDAQHEPPRPYVIESPDVLAVTFLARRGESLRLDSGKRGVLTARAITMKYLVAPDGTIDLDSLGKLVSIAGKTVAEAEAAIQRELKTNNPFALENIARVRIEVAQQNSKVCYIITKDGDKGDYVIRVPITGNTTVLDAIAIPGPILGDVKIWVGRPAPNGVGAETILPVNWGDISSGAAMATNYQLLPGDRLFIEPKQQAAETVPVTAAIEPPRQVPDDVQGRAPAPPFERLPILGPITSGAQVVTLDPPSDEEVLRKLEQSETTPGLPFLRKRDRQAVRIVKEKIADFVDPPQDYPLVGRAQKHHAHYKCTIDSQGGREVVYIDHFHLHMTANVEPPQAIQPAAYDAPARASDESPDEKPVETLKRQRAVLISLTMPDGRRSDWSEKLAEGATISQVINRATYPNPVDLAKASITVSRVHLVDPRWRSAEAQTTWVVGWDADSHSAVGPDEGALQPGDLIAIQFSPPPAAPAKPLKPQADADGAKRRDEPAADAADRAVFISLRMPDGTGVVEWPVEIADGATVGQVLNHTPYPHPIDFDKAMITLTRHARVWQDGRVTEARTSWAIGWDATRHAPPESDDRELQPGDSITIDLSPSPGVAILSDPPRDDVAPAPADRVGKLKVRDIVTVLVNYGGNPKEVLPQDFRIACEITEVRANGNLGIAGQQTIRANGQQWQISLSGQVRREAIQADRTVSSDAVVNLHIYKRKVRLEAPSATADRDDVPADAEGADGDALTEANDENRPARPLAAALSGQLRFGASTAAPAVNSNPTPDAVPPAATAPSATPLATAPVRSGVIEYKLAIIEDLSGDLAEFLGPQNDAGVAILKTSAIQPVLRVLTKHELIKRLGDPRIRTEVDRPAEFNLASKPRSGADRVFVATQRVKILGHHAGGGPQGRSFIVNMDAMAIHDNQRYQVEGAFTITDGETALVKLRTPNGEKPRPLYITVTPEWVE